MAEEPAATGHTPRRRRDRRGRGLRGALLPIGVPLHRSPSQTFDELVVEAVAHLSAAWGEQLNQVDFAVEDVPDLRGPLGDPDRFDVDVVADASIPLGQVIDSSQSPSGRPLIVLFRRPLETRALDDDDLADLVLEVVVDRFAHVLGKDPDEIDPID